MIAYIKVDVGKELPEKNGFYTVYVGDDFCGQSYFINQQFAFYNCKYWLKEISLSELMVGFAEWCSNYDVYVTNERLQIYLTEQKIILE